MKMMVMMMMNKIMLRASCLYDLEEEKKRNQNGSFSLYFWILKFSNDKKQWKNLKYMNMNIKI